MQVLEGNFLVTVSNSWQVPQTGLAGYFWFSFLGMGVDPSSNIHPCTKIQQPTGSMPCKCVMFQVFQSHLIIAQDLSASPWLEGEFPLCEEHFHKVPDI